MQDGSEQTFVQNGGLHGQARLGRTDPPKHSAESRDCPCRPRAPERLGVRVRVRVMSGVGLVRADVQKVEIDDKRPAQRFVPTSPAHSESPPCGL